MDQPGLALIHLISTGSQYSPIKHARIDVMRVVENANHRNGQQGENTAPHVDAEAATSN